LLRRIEAYLATNFEEGRRCLLLIDEAQNLSVKALEELRMLSNFHIDGQAPLQSFLLGQPQFRVTLGSVDLDQLRQRVIASYHLGPVDENETREYVRHRLRAVGWDNDPEITSDAYHEIYVHTGGVPRRINVLCSRLLLFGFLEDQHRLDGDMVKQVAEDLSRETELVVDRQAAQATQAEQEKVPLVATGGGGNEVVSQQLPSDAAAPLAGGGAGNSGLDHRMTAVEGQLQRDERMLGRAQHLISRHERMLHRVQQIIVHHMSGGNPPKKDEP
jgi:hypothetical protein